MKILTKNVEMNLGCETLRQVFIGLKEKKREKLHRTGNVERKSNDRGT